MNDARIIGNGWWCEACGSFVMVNHGGNKCWLCEDCSKTDKAPEPTNKHVIGDWTVSYDPKPIPIRKWDWDAVHKEYDGENDLYFNAASLEEAIEEIKERENN